MTMRLQSQASDNVDYEDTLPSLFFPFGHGQEQRVLVLLGESLTCQSTLTSHDECVFGGRSVWHSPHLKYHRSAVGEEVTHHTIHFIFFF